MKEDIAHSTKTGKQGMDARSITTFWKAALVLIGVAILNPLAVAADAPKDFQVVDGVAIYLGVMPAQIVQGHPKEHPEARMHGGVPTRDHRDHLVVALFDNATRQRIENAKVTGSVVELGLKIQKKKLEPMAIAGTVTYGNYFDMPSNDTHHIKLKLWIRRPGLQGVIEAQFTPRHLGD